MTTVGSSPARSSTRPSIAVVVVLPCAPATATPCRSTPSARRGARRAESRGCRGARLPGFPGSTAAPADERTTTSTAPTCSGRVSRVELETQCFQICRHRCRLQVRSADLRASPQQDFSQRTHATAPHTHEVHGLPSLRHALRLRQARSRVPRSLVPRPAVPAPCRLTHALSAFRIRPPARKSARRDDFRSTPV